jgi:hypothetical protein
VIYDGPINDSDDWQPLPTEPPAPDPVLYSLDPNKLSALTGIDATSIERRGDQKRNGRYVTCNTWELRSTLPRDAAPHEHIKNVLDRMSPAWGTFCDAMKSYSAKMQVVTKAQDPGVFVPLADVLRLAELKASLDIDAYGTVPSAISTRNAIAKRRP